MAAFGSSGSLQAEVLALIEHAQLDMQLSNVNANRRPAEPASSPMRKRARGGEPAATPAGHKRACAPSSASSAIVRALRKHVLPAGAAGAGSAARCAGSDSGELATQLLALQSKEASGLSSRFHHSAAELLARWLLAGRPFEPVISAVSKLRQSWDFDRRHFVEHLVGAPATGHGRPTLPTVVALHHSAVLPLEQFVVIVAARGRPELAAYAQQALAQLRGVDDLSSAGNTTASALRQITLGLLKVQDDAINDGDNMELGGAATAAGHLLGELAGESLSAGGGGHDTLAGSRLAARLLVALAAADTTGPAQAQLLNRLLLASVIRPASQRPGSSAHAAHAAVGPIGQQPAAEDQHAGRRQAELLSCLVSNVGAGGLGRGAAAILLAPSPLPY